MDTSSAIDKNHIQHSSSPSIQPSIRQWRHQKEEKMIDIEWPFATHMDFQGQKMAERLFQVIIILFGIIGFIAGYIMQQFSMTIYSVLFGVFVSAVLTLPPWPIYRNNPVEWQKAVDSSKENKNNPTGKSAKKDTRKTKAKKDE